MNFRIRFQTTMAQTRKELLDKYLESLKPSNDQPSNDQPSNGYEPNNFSSIIDDSQLENTENVVNLINHILVKYNLDSDKNIIARTEDFLTQLESINPTNRHTPSTY